uniref:Fibrinogen C-terminal domain-containing protein n=1 Tax=Anopheles funestus TaxID=62324 RepID=A0A182S2N3_ANOFN
MTKWYVVLLSLVIALVAAHNHPDNQSYPLEEVTITNESRILERTEHLSQTLSEKINRLNERVDELQRDITNKFPVLNETKSSSIEKSIPSTNLDCSYISSCIDPRLNEMQKATNATLVTTNKYWENKSEQLFSSLTSTTQRLNELEHKLEQLPEETGVYFIQPDALKNITFEVSRDWTNNHGFGSWIVFQRRFDGSVDFYRNWTEYKNGFGDLRGEHWLGLEKLYSILKTRRHELLFVLEDFDGVIAYAHYDDFKIGDESEKYAIKSVGRFNGMVGDAFTDHRGSKFSTYDQNNDESFNNCAEEHLGAWWYTRTETNNCYYRYEIFKIL